MTGHPNKSLCEAEVTSDDNFVKHVRSAKSINISGDA